MAPRPTWEGHLRLSLVTCPVRLFKATGEGDAIHFHLLAPETHNRVKQQYKDPEDGVLQRKDLVRGFEVEKDRYVIVEDDEIKKLKVESTKVIDIEKFVETSSIDRLYWEQPYYLAPDGKPAQEPFAVIREAMAREGQVALGRLVMNSRERVVAIETRGRGMLLTTLRAHDEVRAESDVFDAIVDVQISPQMVQIAKQIISQSKGEFNPDEFSDRYQEALRELVEAKAEGQNIVHRPAAGPKESNVIDLMDALRRSLKAPPTPKEEEPLDTKHESAGGKKHARNTRGEGAQSARPPRKGGNHGPRRAAG